MNVCVAGLWHLGTVTATCLASAGHDVTGLDFDAAIVSTLATGKAPLFEPGLDDLVKAGLASGQLHFTTDEAAAVNHADIVWIAYDTPVDDDDRSGLLTRLHTYATSSCSSLERFPIRCSADLQVRRVGRPEGLHYTGMKNAIKPCATVLENAISAAGPRDLVLRAPHRAPPDRGRHAGAELRPVGGAAAGGELREELGARPDLLSQLDATQDQRPGLVHRVMRLPRLKNPTHA